MERHDYFYAMTMLIIHPQPTPEEIKSLVGKLLAELKSESKRDHNNDEKEYIKKVINEDEWLKQVLQSFPLFDIMML